MVHFSRRFVFGLLSAVLLGSAAMAADVVNLGASLSAKNEVPPNGSGGTGSLSATFNPDTKVLTYSVTYEGLSGPAKAAHFHGPAAQGSNAGVVLPFVGSVESPIKGTATLTDAQATDLLAGKWYANVHTAANPGGEIRGQVTTK
jgi:opacity protein-like surface antigen